MTVLEAVILGVLQGATEFLPVSSSGHLAVMRTLMDLGDVPILFDVLLHVATLVVVVAVFWERIWHILRSLARWIARRADDQDQPHLRAALIILVATLLTGVLGVALNSFEFAGRPKVVSALFLVTAAILIASRFFRGERSYKELSFKDAFVVGIAQGFGALPGISRSGISIAASRASGLSREEAGEFAFLISVPAVIGALLLTIGDADQLSAVVSPAGLVLGFLAALLVGLVCLLLLLKLVRSGRLYLFAIYLVPLGIAGILFL
ncbi:MAG: undecaprenyl-diphosphate phosphatase [Spirochaetales bacterium]